MVHLYLLATLGFVGIQAQSFDYYWRDYYGSIPDDALSGGKDINGKKIYIVLVYIHNFGLSVGQVTEGQMVVSVPFYGVKKQDYLIKILCTKHPDNFDWFQTNAKTFHLDMTNKHPVVGGYDHNGNKGSLHIGRVVFQGMIKIGNIASYTLDDVYLFFPNRDREGIAKNYEALIYNNNTKIETFDVDLRLRQTTERL